MTTTPEELRPNRAEAERFLARLDSDATWFTFQTFDDDKERRDKRLARIIHGALSEQFEALARLNAQGAGVFVTVNATDGKGRSAENVVRVRCLFLDLDGAPIPTRCPAPHIITETSPRHWHVYWRVSDVSLDEFSDKQRALISAHSGDPAVCDLPRVMRLPGFFHRKGLPCMVRVVAVSDAPGHRGADFPATRSEPRRPSATLTAEAARVARALAFIPNDDLDWKAWCDTGLAIFSATSGSDAGLAMFDAWSRKSAKYNARDTSRTWDGFVSSPPSRIGFGTVYHLATKACPKWATLLDDGDPEARSIAAKFMGECDS